MVAAGFVEVEFLNRALSTIVFVGKVRVGGVLEEGQGLVYLVVKGAFRLGLGVQGEVNICGGLAVLPQFALREVQMAFCLGGCWVGKAIAYCDGSPCRAERDRGTPG